MWTRTSLSILSAGTCWASSSAVASRVELGHRRLELGHGALGQRLVDGALAQRADVGEAHAVGREHRGVGVDHHPADGQKVGHLAGMLAAGTAEADEGVAADVDAAGDRDLLDRVRHVVVGDGEAALRQLFGRAPRAGRLLDLRRELLELLAHHLGVERLVRIGAEDMRKKLGHELADHEVGVGDGEGAAAAVAGGAGVGAGALGADAHLLAVEGDDRAAAGRHGVDLHHRRAHAHARHLGLEGALEGARIVGDVGGGAAHVEADDALEAGDGRGLDRPHDPAGRAGEDGVLALKEMRVDEAAARLHEHQPGLFGLGRHPVDIAPEDRREIGVDHGRVAAARRSS